jgi:type III pantothenate kinase
MTTLLVDVGNSRLKWACHVNGGLGETRALAHRGEPDAELFERAWADMVPPTRVVVSNVAGRHARDALHEWGCKRWGIAPEFPIAASAACGVINGYSEPGRLGIDRWAALLAAYRRYGGPLAVVDCGTAITVDAIARDGHHRGGLIAPGCTLMHRSLDAGTEGIGPTGRNASGSLTLGVDTPSGVACGVLHGAVGFIEQALATAERVLGEVPQVVITGGDAATLIPFLTTSHPHEPELVLAGLALLAEDRITEDME